MKVYHERKALTFGEFIMAMYGARGERRAKGIVRLAVNEDPVEFREQRRSAISEGSPPKPVPMNTLVEPGSHIRRDDVGMANQADRNSLNQGRPVPLWLEARTHAIGFRHGDLVRTHWKKIRRSMLDD